MKILLVTKKFPYPLREGEPIAIYYLARSLVQLGHELDLLVLNTSKHYFDPAELPAAANFFNEIHSVRVDNHISIRGAVKSLLAGKSYILDRFHSLAFEKKLVDLLRKTQYDVVQLETIYLAHYLTAIRQNSSAIVSLRAHNVEHEIWERVAATSNNLLKKWYLRNQNKHLKCFELAQLNSFDVLLAITGRDLDALRQMGYQNEATIVPVGINLHDYPIDNQRVAQGQCACFIGALDWMPNQHGVAWFLENVWKKLATIYPKAQFHVAGKNTPEWLRNKLEPAAKVHGEVADAKAFLQRFPIMVAPLFSGSGIKIKVLEGMALERVVITTSIGVEGISAEHGRHLLIADTADEFEKQLRWCFENPVNALEIGHAARQFIHRNFDNLEIAGRVDAIYNKLTINRLS
jgi:glycosyltransferase involved in cell wall biosynthesis